MDEMQRQIIKELKVLPVINPKMEIRQRIDFLKRLYDETWIF